jgi:3D (Asp-Asp-Asp) domain-containing protein
MSAVTTFPICRSANAAKMESYRSIFRGEVVMSKIALYLFATSTLVGCGNEVSGTHQTSNDSQKHTTSDQSLPNVAAPSGASTTAQANLPDSNGKGDATASLPQSGQPTKVGASALSAAALAFELPARTIETPLRKLWATWYRTPRFANLENGFDLLDMNGRPLGPKLSHRQWCDAAMEGSVQVLIAGEWKTYNYAGSTGTTQVDCSIYFSHPVGRSRFRLARGPFGDGVRNFILSPYRTIAVDPDVTPYGSVVFVEEARGLPFTMPDGTRRVHDGYFFAGDTGGLIHGNHIDVFIGIDAKSPFAWITSNSNSQIDYRIVPDADIKEALLELHL